MFRPSCSSRSAITTFAPSATKPRAWLAPIPRAAPVMITVRLSKRFMSCSPSLFSSLRGDLLRSWGRHEAWWQHDTGYDLVEHVVDKEVCAPAAILRVD